MKYYLKIVMKGDFPGSPDTDTMEIDSDEYYKIFGRMLKSGNSDMGPIRARFWEFL